MDHLKGVVEDMGLAQENILNTHAIPSSIGYEYVEVILYDLTRLLS